jgi:tetratricopeptide (TPR) repeat protein
MTSSRYVCGSWSDEQPDRFDRDRSQPGKILPGSARPPARPKNGPQASESRRNPRTRAPSPTTNERETGTTAPEWRECHMTEGPMRILVGVVLTATAAVLLTTGARADQSEGQRICLADGTSPDQRLTSCSALIAHGDHADTQTLATIFVSRGNAYLAKSDYGHAQADYDQATRLDPSNIYAFDGRGLVFANQKLYDRAISEFDQAIKLSPKNPIPLTYRGNAYREKGRLDRALQDYNAAIEINPKWTNAYFGRALTFQEKARYDFDAFLNEGSFDGRAIADYEQVIRLNPKGASAYNNRGNIYQSERKYDLAIADFTQAMQLNPSEPLYVKNRAYSYRSSGKYDLAIADYRQALTMKVDNSTRKQIETALKELGAIA